MSNPNSPFTAAKHPDRRVVKTPNDGRHATHCSICFTYNTLSQVCLWKLLEISINATPNNMFQVCDLENKFKGGEMLLIHFWLLYYNLLKSKVAAKNGITSVLCNNGKDNSEISASLYHWPRIFIRKKLNTLKFVRRDIHVWLHSDIDTMLPLVFLPGFKHLATLFHYWQTSSPLKTPWMLNKGFHLLKFH